MLGAAGIGLGSLERVQAPLRLGVAHGAGAAQRAQRRAAAARRQAHHDGAQLAGRPPPGPRRPRSARPTPRAPGRRPTTIVSAELRSARDEQRAEDGEGGGGREAVCESRHGGSVGHAMVTAQARGVPDV